LAIGYIGYWFFGYWLLGIGYWWLVVGDLPIHNRQYRQSKIENRQSKIE